MQGEATIVVHNSAMSKMLYEYFEGRGDVNWRRYKGFVPWLLEQRAQGVKLAILARAYRFVVRVFACVYVCMCEQLQLALVHTHMRTR